MLSSTLSPVPFQEIEGGQFFEERSDVPRGHRRVDVEAFGNLRGDLVACRAAVEQGPDERGGRVEVVNALARPIENDDFSIDASHGEAGPRF